VAGLDTILREIEAGDVHIFAVAGGHPPQRRDRLAELIGPAAGRLHTARSRNDQVATDMKLWVRDAIDETDAALARLQQALAEKALAAAAAIMPGFTHLQVAQPVTFGHHLLAYVEMLARDRGRFADARKRLNESPLGSAALAGTSFPIDRTMTAKALGFDRPTANSLDAVSDRDFVVEALAAASLTAVHLSRLAEELVIWSSPQFGFVGCPTGSPPARRSCRKSAIPDAAELMRAKSGRIVGALTGAPGRAEGPAARLCQGHAGGQGAGLRRLRFAGPLDRCDDRHDRRPDPDDAAMRKAAGAAMRRQPILPTGWCGRSECRSGRRTSSPDASSRPPKRRAWRWKSCRLPRCRRSSPGSRFGVRGARSRGTRSGAARATAARRRKNVRREAESG
jgi:hypothetical protein